MNRILKLSEVMHLTGLSRSTIYKYINEKLFPASIKIGVRSVGWTENDIQTWINNKIPS